MSQELLSAPEREPSSPSAEQRNFQRQIEPILDDIQKSTGELTSHADHIRSRLSSVGHDAAAKSIELHSAHILRVSNRAKRRLESILAQSEGAPSRKIEIILNRLTKAQERLNSETQEIKNTWKRKQKDLEDKASIRAAKNFTSQLREQPKPKLKLAEESYFDIPGQKIVGRALEASAEVLKEKLSQYIPGFITKKLILNVDTSAEPDQFADQYNAQTNSRIHVIQAIARTVENLSPEKRLKFLEEQLAVVSAGLIKIEYILPNKDELKLRRTIDRKTRKFNLRYDVDYHLTPAVTAKRINDLLKNKYDLTREAKAATTSKDRKQAQSDLAELEKELAPLKELSEIHKLEKVQSQITQEKRRTIETVRLLVRLKNQYKQLETDPDSPNAERISQLCQTIESLDPKKKKSEEFQTQFYTRHESPTQSRLTEDQISEYIDFPELLQDDLGQQIKLLLRTHNPDADPNQLSADLLNDHRKITADLASFTDPRFESTPESKKTLVKKLFSDVVDFGRLIRIDAALTGRNLISNESVFQLNEKRLAGVYDYIDNPSSLEGDIDTILREFDELSSSVYVSEDVNRLNNLAHEFQQPEASNSDRIEQYGKIIEILKELKSNLDEQTRFEDALNSYSPKNFSREQLLLYIAVEPAQFETKVKDSLVSINMINNSAGLTPGALADTASSIKKSSKNYFNPDLTYLEKLEIIQQIDSDLSEYRYRIMMETSETANNDQKVWDYIDKEIADKYYDITRFPLKEDEPPAEVSAILTQIEDLKQAFTATYSKYNTADREHPTQWMDELSKQKAEQKEILQSIDTLIESFAEATRIQRQMEIDAQERREQPGYVNLETVKTEYENFLYDLSAFSRYNETREDRSILTNALEALFDDETQPSQEDKMKFIDAAVKLYELINETSFEVVNEESNEGIAVLLGKAGYTDIVNLAETLGVSDYLASKGVSARPAEVAPPSQESGSENSIDKEELGIIFENFITDFAEHYQDENLRTDTNGLATAFDHISQNPSASTLEERREFIDLLVKFYETARKTSFGEGLKEHSAGTRSAPTGYFDIVAIAETLGVSDYLEGYDGKLFGQEQDEMTPKRLFGEENIELGELFGGEASTTSSAENVPAPSPETTSTPEESLPKPTTEAASAQPPVTETKPSPSAKVERDDYDLSPEELREYIDEYNPKLRKEIHDYLDTMEKEIVTPSTGTEVRVKGLSNDLMPALRDRLPALIAEMKTDMDYNLSVLKNAKTLDQYDDAVSALAKKDTGFLYEDFHGRLSALAESLLKEKNESEEAIREAIDGLDIDWEAIARSNLGYPMSELPPIATSTEKAPEQPRAEGEDYDSENLSDLWSRFTSRFKTLSENQLTLTTSISERLTSLKLSPEERNSVIEDALRVTQDLAPGAPLELANKRAKGMLDVKGIAKELGVNLEQYGIAPSKGPARPSTAVESAPAPIETAATEEVAAPETTTESETKAEQFASGWEAFKSTIRESSPSDDQELMIKDVDSFVGQQLGAFDQWDQDSNEKLVGYMVRTINTQGLDEWPDGKAAQENNLQAWNELKKLAKTLDVSLEQYER